MEVDDPYDVVIYGTGMVESLLAAALSRAGQRVLVLEQRSEYGGSRYNMRWAEFDQLTRSVEAGIIPVNGGDVPVDGNIDEIMEGADSEYIDFVNDRDDIRYIEAKSFRIKDERTHANTNDDDEKEESLEEVEPPIITPEMMQIISRHFSIEINTKLLFSSGEMLDVLIDSGVYRYLEFIALQSIYYIADNSLDKLPFSKSEIFQSVMFNPLEKRSLMKFMQFTSDWGRSKQGDDNLTWNEKDVTAERLLHRPQNKKSFESYGYNVQDYCNLPFKDFLDHCKLSEGLQSIIIYSLALQTDAAVSTESALSSLYLHMNSLGRYGPTAFLYPHYGLSELNQAFARMSAVWGCTHMLRTGVRRLVVSPGTEKDHRVKVISHDYQEFSCRHFICEVSSWKGLASTQSVLQRVSLFKGCILPVTDEGSSFIVISPQCPGVGNEYGIYVVQHGASSCTTTGDYYKLHMSTRCPSEGVSDFDLAELMERAIEYLMSKSLHKGTDVIELAHLTTITPVLDTASITLPESVYVISHYDEDLHYERAVFEARRVFAQVCEDKNFFEKLPTEHATEELNEMDELDSALDNIGAYANRSHLGGNDSDEVTVSIINA